MIKTLKVRELAEAKGFNISDLSFETRISYKQMHRIWHNKVDVDKMDYGTLVRLSEALDVKIEGLFEEVEDIEINNRTPFRVAA
jgi:DNA-binding Xre family transcriptional regulator